jgi:hypothetical protein
MRVCKGIHLALLLAVFAVCPAFAQDIVVRALNGKTGHPFLQNHLLLWAFDDLSGRGSAQQLDLYTDQHGTAVIRSGTLKYSHLQVWVDFQHQCNANPNAVSIKVDEILQKGFVAENNCSEKIKSAPAPGVLVVYARAPTLRERMNW